MAETSMQKRAELERSANLIFNVGTILEDREELPSWQFDRLWNYLYEHMDDLYTRIGPIIDEVQDTLFSEGAPSMFFVVDRRGYDIPDLVGPFVSHEDAEVYAAHYHPDDVDGSVWVLRAAAPVDERT